MILLFDIYLEGKFYTQIKYNGMGKLSLDDKGNVVQSVSAQEMRQFVEAKLPTLKGRKFSFYQTQNRLFKR